MFTGVVPETPIRSPRERVVGQSRVIPYRKPASQKLRICGKLIDIQGKNKGGGDRRKTQEKQLVALAVTATILFIPVRVAVVYHRTMHELHHRMNSKEVVVRWCVKLFWPVSSLFRIPGHSHPTGSNLNAGPALIQNLYSRETTPLQAVHLTIDTGLEESGKGAGIKAYIKSVHFWQHNMHPLIPHQFTGQNLP